MRRPFVAGNWKMNKSIEDGRALVRALRGQVSDDVPVTVAVCPPFQLLVPIGEEAQGSAIRLGAQNCHFEAKGAFTGEVAPQMLIDVGCTYVIIGHSERRQHFGEGGDLLARKVRSAQSSGLHVIFCLGETLEQRESGKTQDVVRGQLEEVLDAKLDFSNLTVAYEPVWAIGTGKTATPDQAQEMHAFIRDWVRKQIGGEVADGLVIQYGGSVKPGNALELMRCPDIDGALVGGASLVAEDFAAIIRAAAEAQ